MHYYKHLVVGIAAFVPLGAATAAITFEQPYVFVSEQEARDGAALPLSGGDDKQFTYISVRIFKWSQNENEEFILTPTDDIAVYPQLVRVEKESKVNVRFVWNSASARQDGTYYRIILQEFDSPLDKPEVEEATGFVLKFRPKVSLPLIIGSEKATDAKVVVQSVRAVTQPAEGKDGTLDKAVATKAATQIQLYNEGGTYARVLGIRDAAGKIHGINRYILPQSVQNVTFSQPLAAGPVTAIYSSGISEHVPKPETPLRESVHGNSEEVKP